MYILISVVLEESCNIGLHTQTEYHKLTYSKANVIVGVQDLHNEDKQLILFQSGIDEQSAFITGLFIWTNMNSDKLTAVTYIKNTKS